MIIGNCPTCDKVFMLSMAETPRIEHHLCEHCQAEIWTIHSRLDPRSYSSEEFHRLYEVDEKSRTIRRKVQNDN